MVFPIFFLYSRYNSLWFFLRILVRDVYSISAFLVRYVALVGKMRKTKGRKGESKMRPCDTKASRRVDSRRNELLAPFRTVSSLRNWFPRLLQHDAICDRTEKTEVLRGFHANQFCMIISRISYYM